MQSTDFGDVDYPPIDAPVCLSLLERRSPRLNGFSIDDNIRRNFILLQDLAPKEYEPFPMPTDNNSLTFESEFRILLIVYGSRRLCCK
jgi:hypothetical protein